MGTSREPIPPVARATPAAEVIAVACTLMAVALVHARSLARPFFADDYLFLEQVRGLDLLAALASPDPIGNYLRPVGRQLWFWLVSRMGGESPLVFHTLGLCAYFGALIAFHQIVRRLAGGRAAWFAMTFVALHYAADVPLRWASGSQDLLAILFGLLAILWTCSGRRTLAAGALALGLLSKEVIAGVPVIALLADRRQGEPLRETFRRSAGLFGVLAVWGLWKAVTLLGRSGADGSFNLAPMNVIAAAAHLAQVSLGLEFRAAGSPIGHWTSWSVALAAAVALAALAMSKRDRGSVATPLDGRAVVGLGATWTLLGLLPTIPVVPIWSAYFYLWALFGIALLLGLACRRLPAAAASALLALSVFLSANARALDEFSAVAGGGQQSHVNRFYIDRSLDTIQDYIRQMRTARPTLPARSTVFFADVSPSSGFQTADGPLIRWAYRDTSLRSWFLTQFTLERAARGPVYFFVARGEQLEDRTEDPQFLPSLAYSSILAEKPQVAQDALDLVIRSGRPEPDWRYWRGIVRTALGDSVGGRSDWASIGMSSSSEAVAIPEWSPGRRDSASRIAELRSLTRRAPLAPQPHARLAALLLARGALVDGAIEAYAFRTLSPDSADAWRKWASAQLSAQQYGPALASLERYLQIRRTQGIPDTEAEAITLKLQRLLRGDLASASLREGSNGK